MRNGVLAAICLAVFAETLAALQVVSYLSAYVLLLAPPQGSNQGLWVGLLLGSNSIARGVGSLIFVFLADKVGHRATISVGLVGSSVALLGFACSRSLLEALVIEAPPSLLGGGGPVSIGCEL